MTAVAESLKVEGQERSTSGLDPELVEAFLRVVAAVPQGDRVSVNELRGALDGLGIPQRSRGGLFARAVSKGLLTPMEVQVGRSVFPVRIPSTGRSAHAATVRVYERKGGALW